MNPLYKSDQEIPLKTADLIDKHIPRNEKSTKEAFFDTEEKFLKIHTRFQNTGTSHDICNALGRLNNCFKLHQDQTLFNLFIDNNYFAMLINFLSNDDKLVRYSAISCISTFTTRNLDMIQLFIENGLFLNISDLLHSDEYSILIESLNTLIHISSFQQSVHIRRISQILSPSMILTLISTDDTNINTCCAKLLNHLIVFPFTDDQIQQLIQCMSHLLQSPNQEGQKYSLSTLNRYLKLDSINVNLIQENNISQIIMSLIENENSQICELALQNVGSLINLHLIDNIDPTVLFNIIQENPSENIRSLAFWCLQCALKQNTINDLKKAMSDLIELCVSQLEDSSFQVVLDSALSMISVLKILDTSVYSYFNLEDIIELLIKYLQLNDEQVINGSFQILVRLYNLEKASQNQNEVVQYFDDHDGKHIIQEFIENERYSSIAKSVDFIFFGNNCELEG